MSNPTYPPPSGARQDAGGAQTVQPRPHRSDGQPAGHPGKRRGPRLLWVSISVLLLLAAAGIALLYWGAERAGVSPRRVASYFEQRVHGSGAVAGTVRQWSAIFLRAQDRGGAPVMPTQGLKVGVQPEPAGPDHAAEAGRIVPVADAASLTAAIANARPGDVIELAPGSYRLGGARYVSVRNPGTASQPITVRAARPGTALLAFDMMEGMVVTAPYWHFENLDIQGVCSDHSYCEHAFHVVGGGAHFVSRNNRIRDFNAHFKINGSDGVFPDDGLIEANSLSNTTLRNTRNPVITIDLVGANGWMVRKNLITDFLKAEAGTSYGAYFKGGGARNVFENNIVYCESTLHDARAQEVGLSLGGGGTGQPYCRDRKCITEQDEGVIRGNLIAACSDDGIYLNKSARSLVLHNTLIDTGGISVRFSASSADVEGNLVDGAIRARDDAILRKTDNRDTALGTLFLGLHPVRKLVTPQEHAAGAPTIPYREGAPPKEPVPDLCGTPHAGRVPYGAFARFDDCRR